MDTIWAVDGLFYAQRLSGIQRYSAELLRALDELVEPGWVEVVLPPDPPAPELKHIAVVRAGRRTGFAWEQLDYPRYLRENRRAGLCTCNVIPLLGFRGMAVVHDVCYRARPDFYRDLRGRASALWHRMQYRVIACRADRIITVSEFSRSELTAYYGVPPRKMTVIPNAWQHIRRVEADETIFDRQPRLQKGGYYFSMANLLKNKNFPWVLQAARRKPEAVFAIAGGGSLRDLPGADLPNVVYLGYVSDGEAKALMANCRAFLFPTLYEGFGIPPLEAIACGAPAVYVSDTPCMREVYGDNAGYIDLKVNHGDVDAVLPAASPAAGALERYSWRQSAEKLLALL